MKPPKTMSTVGVGSHSVNRRISGDRVAPEKWKALPPSPVINTRRYQKAGNNMEIWKPVKGYEWFYEVSNLGNVRNAATGKILKSTPRGTGYLGVSLYDENGDSKQVYVHRLVADAFCKNPDGKETVNHKNENKQDNRASNLEWVTIQENLLYGTRLKRISEKKTNGYGSKKVSQFSKDGEFIKTYPSTAQAAREVGCSGADIRKAIIGKYKRCAGYVWRYAEDVK